MKRTPLLSTLAAFVLSFLFIGSPLVHAQVPTTSLPGITVLGQGRASVPAETATVFIMVGSGEYYKEEVMGEEPAEEPSPAASPEVTLAPVVDALVALGIPAEEIDVLVDPTSGYYTPEGTPSMMSLRFTIADPTTDRLSELISAAVKATLDAGMYINLVGAVYGVSDCASLERQAREDAIADARENAALQAELLGVSVGDVVASRDDTYGAMAYGSSYGGGVQINSCTMPDVDVTTASMYSAPAFDPTAEPAVVVNAFVEITFAIEGASGTPAS